MEGHHGNRQSFETLGGALRKVTFYYVGYSCHSAGFVQQGLLYNYQSLSDLRINFKAEYRKNAVSEEILTSAMKHLRTVALVGGVGISVILVLVWPAGMTNITVMTVNEFQHWVRRHCQMF